MSIEWDWTKVQVVASISGGKDSTAMALWLREQGIAYRAIHLDTGWEHPDTYAYLRALPEILGRPIEVHQRLPPPLDARRAAMAEEVEAMLALDGPDAPPRVSPMVRWALHKAMFASRVRRWCTQELKLTTARSVLQAIALEAGKVPVNAIGVRAAESVARAALPERELSPQMDCYVWRPLIAWSESDVIAIHQRHNVAPNPLYLRGAGRVGCWPCIQAGKTELRLLTADSRRVRAIELLERFVGELAAERAAARGAEPVNPPAFFQHPTRQPGPVQNPTVPILQMLEWAATARGGKRTIDVEAANADAANDGCMQWGLCEAPQLDLWEREPAREEEP